MAELLDAYDPCGKIIMTQERKRLLAMLREESLAHCSAPLAVPVVHLLLVTPSGELYIAQRADKEENPFLWDKTVGGHVVSGETPETTLVREADEELGLRLNIVDASAYRLAVQREDLTQCAVASLADFLPWNVSVRARRDGTFWNKRDRASVFIGTYDGNVSYRDGEVIDSRVMLPCKIAASGLQTTYDLRMMVKKYSHLLVGLPGR